MWVYYLVILLNLFFLTRISLFPEGERRDLKELRFLQIICIVLVLLAAFRSPSVGADTLGYMADYLSTVPQLSFKEVFEKYGDYVGFYLFAKICTLLHLPLPVFFGLVEWLYIFAVYRFVCRFSSDRLYSILGFTVIGLYSFSLAGLKQTMSMAFMLMSYTYLVDKRFLRAFLLGVFAFFCHKVSLIFMAGFALYFMRHHKFYYVYLAVIVLVVLLGTKIVWTGLLSLLQNDHYSELYGGDEGYSSTTMIYYGVLLLLLLLFSGRYVYLRKDESRIMIGMATLSFVFQAFSFVSSAAFRLSYYFLPFIVVAFPNSFELIENSDLRRLVKVGVAMILIFFFLYTNRNGGYKFFWQT